MSDELCTAMTWGDLVLATVFFQVFAFAAGAYACWVWNTGRLWK